MHKPRQGVTSDRKQKEKNLICKGHSKPNKPNIEYTSKKQQRRFMMYLSVFHFFRLYNFFKNFL